MEFLSNMWSSFKNQLAKSEDKILEVCFFDYIDISTTFTFMTTTTFPKKCWWRPLLTQK